MGSKLVRDKNMKREDQRAEIEKDIELFLKHGGQIKQIVTGLSGETGFDPGTSVKPQTKVYIAQPVSYGSL